MKRTWLPLALLLLSLLPALYYAGTYREMAHLGHFHDDGVYMGSAMRLAEGRGFVVASAPGEPAQTRFPILFPLYLSIGYKLGGGFIALIWLLLPLFLILLRRWYLSAGLGDWQAAILCAFMAVNTYTVLFSISPMSELFACCLLFGALLAIEQESIAWIIVAGVLSAGAYLTRSALIAVPAGLGLYLLLRRRWVPALVYAVTAAPAVLIWNSFVSTHANPNAKGAAVFYTNYLGFYKENVTLETLPTVIGTNLVHLIQSLTNVLYFEGGGNPIEFNLARLLALGAIAGVVKWAMAKRLTPYHLFALIYAAGLLIWNYVPHERLVYPLVPLVLVGLSNEVLGFVAMLKQSWQKQRAAAIVIGALFGLIFAGLIFRDVQGVTSRLSSLLDRHRDFRAEKQQAFDWIKANTNATDNFLAYDEPVLHLNTGRHGYGMHFPSRYFYADDRKSILQFFKDGPKMARTEGLQYIFETPYDFEQDLEDPEPTEVRKAWAADMGLDLVYQTPQIRIRKVSRP